MATGPNRASPPVYEDFRPVSEWHQEAGAEILLIFLPGGFLLHLYSYFNRTSTYSRIFFKNIVTLIPIYQS